MTFATDEPLAGLIEGGLGGKVLVIHKICRLESLVSHKTAK